MVGGSINFSLKVSTIKGFARKQNGTHFLTTKSAINGIKNNTNLKIVITSHASVKALALAYKLEREGLSPR